MQVAEQVGTLEEVTAKLAERRATVAGLQREVEAATQEAAGLKNLREKFLVPASAGDAAATRHAQEIEGQQQVIGRKIEGLQIRLQTAERELHEIEVEHAALAQAAAAQERRKAFEETRDKVKKSGWNWQATIRAAHRLTYDVAVGYLHDVENAGWSDSEKATLADDFQEAAKLPNKANEEHIGAGAKFAVGMFPAFLRSTTIQPWQPPDELRHLEILR
jgi:uncharacterized coiled-coil protein SlyX